jgi:hypothetical protein
LSYILCRVFVNRTLWPLDSSTAPKWEKEVWRE